MIRSKFHAIGDYEEGLISRERFPVLQGSTDERIYATGDIVQQLPDGNLLHLGRLGRMVKIRGNRVFLSEIEQQLRSINGVTSAAVVEKEEHENVVLYGFVTTDSTVFTSKDLRDLLASKLPDFMIPRSVDTLLSIPLMAGGKTDYQALVQLISAPNTFSNTEVPQDDYTRLIQVWDSILFQGAHHYPSDFFSLGGDSLSFMVLIVEVESVFGKSLQVEEFRANCTLHYLGTILGINCPNSQPTIKYKSLQARLFSTSIGSSKGIALAVPGYGGLSQAYSFHKAGFFQDYDIWIVEFPIKEGNMLQADRWCIATLEIVEAIKEGIIPAPSIVFGFSFAGGLAWFISRLLAGLHMPPKFVVMVDARPLHNRLTFKHKTVKKALQNVSTKAPSQVIHIRRSTLGKFEIFKKKEVLWDKNDTVHKLINLPTIYHQDMINWEVLAFAKDNVNAFMNGQDINFHLNSALPPPNLWGCLVFCALDGNQIALSILMDKLTNVAENLSLEHLIDSAILMYTINDKNKVRELIQLALKKFPHSVTVHYLSRRIKRNTNLLFYGDISKIYPLIILSFENALTPLEKLITKPKPLAIRHLLLAIDLAYALIASKCISWKYYVVSYVSNRKLY